MTVCSVSAWMLVRDGLEIDLRCVGSQGQTKWGFCSTDQSRSLMTDFGSTDWEVSTCGLREDAVRARTGERMSSRERAKAMVWTSGHL